MDSMQERNSWNNGEWTKAKFNSFIKSILRAGSRRWGPKYKCLNQACIGVKVNAATNRLAKHYTCAKCGDSFPAARVQVDHCQPIINPEIGFTTWDNVINAMFCEQDNLQVLCIPCHKIKTQAEKLRKGK